MAEEKAEEKIPLRDRLTFVKLVPDTATAAACGGTIATTMLRGREVNIRCATMRDLARVEKIIGKNFFAAKLNIATDVDPEQFAQIMEMALSKNDPPVTKDEILDCGVSEWGRLVEVGLCFLSAGAL